MAEGEDRDGRRYPCNLEGILKFCIENTKAEDTTQPSHFREMSPEVGFFLSFIIDCCSSSPPRLTYITVVKGLEGNRGSKLSISLIHECIYDQFAYSLIIVYK